MDLNSLNFFQMTRKKLDWLSKKQATVAQNIANANTPGYVAKSISPLDFSDELAKVSSQANSKIAVTNSGHIGGNGNSSSSVVITNPNHIGGGAGIDSQVSGGAGKFGYADSGVYETSIDGNGVILEEQMAEIGDIKTQHDLAVSLFKKNVKLLKIAIGKK
jgi:flagellar basal-body rod protein FlgB